MLGLGFYVSVCVKDSGSCSTPGSSCSCTWKPHFYLIWGSVSRGGCQSPGLSKPVTPCHSTPKASRTTRTLSHLGTQDSHISFPGISSPTRPGLSSGSEATQSSKVARPRSSVALASTRVELSSSSVWLSSIGISRKFPQSALRLLEEEPLWGAPTSGQGPGTSDPGVLSGATRDAAWLWRVLENTGEN